jgi:hypothetical protein
MVLDLTKKGYRCPYCNKFFEDYNLALSCAEDCADIEVPEDDIIEKYRCEMCFETFDVENEAELCESLHKVNKDNSYIQYLERKEREKLLEAGNHPNQKKLAER